MSGTQDLFFEPAPPIPAGIMMPKMIMLTQGVIGILGAAVHMFWFVYSISAEWPVDLWSLGVALVVAALAGTAFNLAVRLEPGNTKLWRTSLVLQGAVGALWLWGALSIFITDPAPTTLRSIVENPFLILAAVCWTAFALLLLPSSRPSRPERTRDLN